MTPPISVGKALSFVFDVTEPSCSLATYRFGAAVNLDLDWRWRATDKPSDEVMDAKLRAVHFKNSWAASRSSVSDKSHGKLRSTKPDRCSRKASLLSFFDLDFLLLLGHLCRFRQVDV